MQLHKSTFEKNPEYIQVVDNVIKEAQKTHDVSWFNGYPVGTELKELLDTLADKLPHVRFIPVVKTWDSHYRFTKFHAVMDGAPFTLGWVGYGDFSISGQTERKYCIYSRKIQNGKYNPHRDQFRMVMPVNLAKAVKEAKRYLIPYTPLELAKYTFKQIHDPTSKVVSAFYRRINKPLEAMTPYGVTAIKARELIEELVNIRNAGVVLQTKLFKEPMDFLDDAVEALNERIAYKPKPVFVQIEAGSNPMVHVLESDITAYRADKFEVTTANSYQTEDIPEWVMNRLAVLQILNDEQYVEQVGYKHDNYIYWVEKHDAE